MRRMEQENKEVSGDEPESELEADEGDENGEAVAANGVEQSAGLELV
jgi:hypothetical protein